MDDKYIKRNSRNIAGIHDTGKTGSTKKTGFIRYTKKNDNIEFTNSNSNKAETNDLSSYKAAVESANAKVKATEPKITTAAAKVTSAQAKLSAAKNTLNNTKPTIDKQIQTGTDANNQPVFKTVQEPNPAYQEAQDTVSAAEGELSAAKDEKKAAEDEKKTAETEKKEAEGKLEKAEKENKEAQEALEKAQEEAEEEQKPDVESDENNENQTEEYSPLEFFNDFRLKFEKGFNFLFGNKDNKTNSAYDIPQYVTTDGVYDLRNLETDKNKAAINLSSAPIIKTQKTSLQNSSKNKNVKADKNQTESDNSTKQTSNNKTMETLSKLQEDISLSDAVKNGTQLINDIKNAQTKEQVHDIILAKCGNDSDNAEKIYNYIMTNSPTGNNDSEYNPYKKANNIYLMNLLYSNNGDKLVLSDNLLNVFKETTTSKDIDGNETEIPKKEYYVNYAGEICSIDYKYHEAKEDKAEYITMKFNEGDTTSEINYYETQNDNGETFFHIMDSDGKDKITETQDEFLKRLVVIKNYTQDIENSDFSTDEINERYTVLKEQDDNIANSMSALIKEFQSQGWFDRRYNYFKELTGLGLTPEELSEELDGMSNYNKIMMDAENGDIDKAKNLAEKEFDRRLQNAKNWQEVYEELKTYYQDEKIALDIMNNTLCSDKGSVGLDNNGKIVASATDQFGQSGSCEGKDIKFAGDLSLEKIKQSCNNEVKNYKLDTKEAIYKFLFRGGELSQENIDIDSFHKAEDKFTDYNTAIAYGEALRECKTPEEAFYVITGKNIKEDEITNDDIELFNKYYTLDNNSNPARFIDETTGIEHTFKLEIQYNKEKKDFDIKYQEYILDENSLQYKPKGEPKNEIPDFDSYNVSGKSALQIYNSNGISDALQQDKFSEFYNKNSEYVNNCIENYANWAINDKDAKKHFKKVLGREPQNADEIIKYLKEDGLYSESANYMQYDYTTKKQTLMGESKLDKLTSDYCTDMATYTSKVAHGLTMGFLLASVFLPVSGPAAKAISIATRASGYVDNVADFINMATNKQNYLDDNYANLLTSTAFEVFTKQGYRFFSGIASSESDKFLHSLIQNTGLEDSPYANNTLLAVLAKGSFEALVETGIALPFTAAVKTVQGGKYDLWDELKGNFFYDFLPYANGWRTILSDAKAEMYTGSDNDGKYYYSLNEPSKRIYVDENDKPIKIVSAADDENKTVLTDYEYSKDGGNESVKVKHYNEDGSEKSCTVIEDNGKKVTWLNENGEPLITKSVENTENGSVTKYYRNGSDTPELTETRDKKGRLITAEGTDTKETFDKSGRCVEMVQKTKSGENTVFSFDSTYGKQQGKIIVQDPGDGTCSMAALMIVAKTKGTDSKLFKMCNEQVYDKSTCAYLAEKLGLEDADFSTNREPFQVLYEAYANEHPNSGGNFATEVLGVYFDGGNKVLMEFDGNKEKIQEYASNKDTALTFSTSEKITVTDANGKSVELSNGHAYAVVGYDNDGLKLVDPEDPDKVITIPESEMEKLKNAQVAGGTWKEGDEGYIQEGVEENFVRGTNAIQTNIDGIKDILSMSNSKFKKLKHALSSAEIGYTRTENQYEITKIGDNLYSIVDTTGNKDTLSSFEMIEFLEKRASNTAMQEKLRVLYNSGLIDDLALKTIYDAQLKKESIFEDPTAGKKYAEALKMYKTRTYKLYNRIARGEKITDELIEECKSIGMTIGEIKSKIKYLSDYISTSELEEGLQLYRSDTYDVFSEVTIENGVFKGENLSELLRKAENGDIDISEIENALKNQTIEQKAFLSTSLTEDGAMEYQTRTDREIEWIFTTKQHTQGMYIDIFMDKFTAEWEVLVDTNSKININKVEYKNNRWCIYADLSS